MPVPSRIPLGIPTASPHSSPPVLGRRHPEGCAGWPPPAGGTHRQPRLRLRHRPHSPRTHSSDMAAAPLPPPRLSCGPDSRPRLSSCRPAAAGRPGDEEEEEKEDEEEEKRGRSAGGAGPPSPAEGRQRPGRGGQGGSCPQPSRHGRQGAPPRAAPQGRGGRAPSSRCFASAFLLFFFFFSNCCFTPALV